MTHLVVTGKYRGLKCILLGSWRGGTLHRKQIRARLEDGREIIMAPSNVMEVENPTEAPTRVKATISRKPALSVDGGHSKRKSKGKTGASWPNSGPLS